MPPRRLGGRSIVTASTVGACALLGLLAGCSSGDSGDTLSPVDGPAGTATATATVPASAANAGTTVDPASAGTGFVEVQVQVASTGVNETLSLDRSTVSKAAFDPVSLDAKCTPLDKGDTSQGVDVVVVDLRRLGAGAKLVSATLHVDSAAEGGKHGATLQLGGADQVTTSYTGSADLADGGWAGSFSLADAAGNAATGTFTCADQAPPPTTTVPDTDGGEAVPDTPAPTAPDNT
jgi:hypothetical protein